MSAGTSVADRCYEFERDHWWYRGRRRILLGTTGHGFGTGVSLAAVARKIAAGS